MQRKRRSPGKRAGAVAIMIAVLCCVPVIFSGKRSESAAEKKDFRQILYNAAYEQTEKNCFLLYPFLLTNGEIEEDDFLKERILEEILPLYGYLKQEEPERETEDALLAEIIKQREGTDEDIKNIEESRLDYEEDAMHIEGSMLKDMQEENDRYREASEAEEKAEEAGKEDGQNDSADGETAVFFPQQYPVYSYDWSEEWGYEDLVSNFYAVDNSTSLKEEYIDLEQLLYRDMTVDKDTKGPQILIYHTHSREGFADSLPGDASTTIVGAGEKLAKLLTEEYGFWVLHHTGEYDVENRDYAYNNSLPALEKILEENPTIEVVIDLHRDEMKEGKKLVIDLQGRPTARFMLFNGMSYVRNKGEITYLENPYIQDNLALSFQTQVAANEYYPGIARKIYLKAYRYNMHLKPKSMLIELGAQTNTVEEIMNACDPLAHIISIVLGE